MKGKEKTSTHLGKLISIFIISFLCYMILSSDMLNKTNPSVLMQEMEVNSRPELKLTRDDFTLVFAISDIDNFSYEPDETIFHWDVRSWKYENDPKNGGYQKILDEKKTFHVCTEEDFPRNPEIYGNLGLKSAICLDQNNITVAGYWDEKQVSSFIIELYKCKNGSQENVICKSEEEINKFLGQKIFNIWIEQKSIDANNYEDPISYKIKNYYNTVYTDKYKINHLFLKNVLFTTNDGFFFDNKYTKTTYLHGDFDSDTSDVLDDGLIYDFMIYSSGQQKEIIRNYQKISTLLANLGGICNSLMIFGFIICKLQNNLNLKKKIICSLYNIGEAATTLKRTINFKVTQSKKNSLFIHHDKTDEKIKLKKLEEFQKHIVSKSKLEFSLINYIKTLIIPYKSMTKKEKIFKVGEELFNQDIDVVRILKKLKEIDKLKSILLDQNQNFFFDLLSKPTINVNLHRKNSKYPMEDSLRYGGKKINSAEMILKYNEMCNKSNKSELDVRILELIDENIKKSLGANEKIIRGSNSNIFQLSSDQ